MFRVIEISRDRLFRRRDVVSAADLVTGKTFSARKFAASLHRRMTLETSVMRRLTIRNAEINAFAACFMTRRAILLIVLDVIEFHAETARIRHFLVTFTAIRKIIRAESLLSVMARRAIIVRAGVHSRRDRRHIVSARRIVTALTIQTAVTRMAEIVTNLRDGSRNLIGFTRFVTGCARTDIFLTDDLFRRMTLKTIAVRVRTRRNRHIYALRLMARRTVRFLQMRRMIELHAETLDWRKFLDFAAFGVCVTGRANGVIFILKLLNVTTRAGLMSHKFGLRRFFILFVANQTRNARVTTFVMLERRKIDIRHIFRLLFRFERFKGIGRRLFYLD